MSTETFLFLVLAAGAAYWYWKKSRPHVTPAPQCKAQEPPSQSPIREPEEADPLLRAVLLEKERTDSAISDARHQHERELETRFADDMKLKERLSKFARSQKLDSALCDLWKEIRHYPAWSSRDDFENWNKLHLSGISGSKEGDIESVEFSHGNQRFKITERRWYGTEGERYSDMSLFEDSEEVFAISCSIHDEYDVDAYSCHGISAFKKRGNWPQVILGYNAKIQIERQNITDGFKYFRADEIKSRFEE
ncbi:hypothetical protein [Ideonella oryzae]|uniref:WYL domain-containing protein n=1 Tax=Ideonella oryzae TaxID=2937441 RepID=A0ABT1BR13_9BURK|nr:hypothetical protein [Ideonella oryzae]MCO5978677.1 hypothetical protein [Ideonella oryzae]